MTTTNNNDRSTSIIRCICMTSLLTILILADNSSAKPTTLSEKAAATEKKLALTTDKETLKCYSECKKNRDLCYNDIDNDSFQEAILCMQAVQSCMADCDAEVKLREKMEKMIKNLDKSQRLRLLMKGLWS